jgi:predicted RNase H-like HicB family nuclease
VDNLLKYRRMALKMAEIVELGDDEGYAAKIPGFAGLMAVGSSKREAVSELASALDDWMSLALKRGLGLPALNAPKTSRPRVLVRA